MSMWLLAKSAAYRRLPPAAAAIASPVYTWPGWLEAITPVIELAAGALGFQPMILPVIEENRNRATQGGAAHAPGSAKSVVLLFATVPVGNPPGMVTKGIAATGTTGLPLTSPL